MEGLWATSQVMEWSAETLVCSLEGEKYADVSAADDAGSELAFPQSRADVQG